MAVSTVHQLYKSAENEKLEASDLNQRRMRSLTLPLTCANLHLRMINLQRKQQDDLAWFGPMTVSLSDKKRLKEERIKLFDCKPESVKCYYQVLLQELSSAFMAVFLLQNGLRFFEPFFGLLSGENTLKPALTWLPHLYEFIHSFCEWVPVLGITGRIRAGIIQWQKCIDKKKLHQTRGAFWGLTPKALQKIADDIARQLSLAYESRICLLTAEGALRFAECGVIRVMNGLLSEQITSENFADRACWVVRHVELDPIHLDLFALFEISWFHRPLLALLDEDLFLEDDLYRLSTQEIKTRQTQWNPEEDRLKLEILS